jgi:DNA-binding MarR family transcriptional regulator
LISNGNWLPSSSKHRDCCAIISINVPERGTTRAQWIVLFRLRQQEGLTQVDLADVLELQPISLVRLLDRLVDHKLLERKPDPKDRRANRLFLTPKGRKLVDDLDSLRDAIAGDVFARHSGKCRGINVKNAG